MNQWFSKSQKAVFITVFLIAISVALQNKTTVAFAEEADSGKHEAVDELWKDSVQPENSENQQNPEQTHTPDNTDTNKPATNDADTNEPGSNNADVNEPGTNNADANEPDSNNADANEAPSNDTATEEEPTGDTNQDEQAPDEQAPPAEKPDIKASLKEKKNTKAATIHWNSVQGAKTYKVQRSTEKYGKFKNIASIEIPTENTTENTSEHTAQKYKDTGVKKGSSYYYRIAVKMADGTTCYSNAVSFICPYAKVSGIQLSRHSSSSVKVSWKPGDGQANYYKVYYAKEAQGDYKLAGTTKDTSYRVTGLKSNQDYYFKVKACAAKKASSLDGELSDAVKIRTAPYNRTTIFAGDSITVGLRTYNILGGMAIEGNKGIVAEIGLNTTTFRTRRVFDGKTGVETIIAAKPYRVYLMLGDNEIHYRSKEDTVAGFREILKRIQAGTPDTDIVVLAATPVTSAKVAAQKGFAQIPAYNQSLKKLAKSMGVRYFDCTDFLKDADGWLKTSYAAGDGIHWTAEAYREYAKRLEAYDRTLD